MKLFIFAFLYPFFLFADVSFYVISPYAEVHEMPSKQALAVDYLHCGQRVRLVKKEDISRDFFSVKYAKKTGFINKKFLSQKRVQCPQKKYAYFFEGLPLDADDRIYWGKLYEQFYMGEVKAK